MSRAAWTAALNPTAAAQPKQKRMRQSTAMAAIVRAHTPKLSQDQRLKQDLAYYEQMVAHDAAIPERQVFDMDAVPKPRMTQKDKWEKRDCVERYRGFCDELRLRGAKLPHAYRLEITVAMPEGWPEEIKQAFCGRPMLRKADASNLVKAIEDALFKKDERLHNIGAIKRWGYKGRIVIVKVDQDHI